MARWPWTRNPAKPAPEAEIRRLRRPVELHLGTALADAHTVSHEIKSVERINLQRAIDRWAEESRPAAQLFGYSTKGYFSDDGLIAHLVTDELTQAPFERLRVESGPGEGVDCTLRGLYLVHRDGEPIVLAFRPPRLTRELPVMEVFAATRETASRTLTALLEQAQRDSVYRGRTLSLEQSRGWGEGFTIRFHDLRSTAREQIVLPEELLVVVDRNVLGMMRHAGALRAAGRRLRRGLLFHGPPGTGKTLVVRYLASECKDHTIILLTGSRQGLIREACDVARLLSPSIVVLEDVDLIAEDRDHNRCASVLHELLNEMDGLLGGDDVVFLLTTNRPEILEPALAARPGRIDQAVAFPLPDEACRRKLFAVYGRGLDLSALDLERWVAQTRGVSPAFIEELLRKAVLMAAERGEASNPVRLRDQDVQDAIRELVFFGGELTQKLLGYRPSRIGYQASAHVAAPGVTGES